MTSTVHREAQNKSSTWQLSKSYIRDDRVADKSKKADMDIDINTEGHGTQNSQVISPASSNHNSQSNGKSVSAKVTEEQFNHYLSDSNSDEATPDNLTSNRGTVRKKDDESTEDESGMDVNDEESYYDNIENSDEDA